MKKILLSSFIIAVITMTSINVQSQDKSTSGKVETYVDEPSNPIKGMKHLTSYLSTEVKYPKQARRLGVEGTVYVEFVVDKSGTIGKHTVIKGIGAGCDNEALRALIEYPEKWTLARHQGKVVNQKVVLPVQFKLGEKANTVEDKS